MVNLSCLLVAVVPFLTEHRNMYPSNMVSTNFYGSVTGIVDSAYIAEHSSIVNERDPLFASWTNGESIALGRIAKVSSPKGTAVGAGTIASGDDYAVAMGYATTASGRHSFALGAGGAIASAENAVAIGNSTQARGNSSTSVGFSSFADGVMSAAFGGNTYARGARSLATGWSAVADAKNSTAIGNGSWVKTNALGAVAIGSGAQVGLGATNAVQIGYGVNTNAETIQFMSIRLVGADEISSTNPSFSNAVLNVAFDLVDTNAVEVLNAIASGFGGNPIEGTATTIGGLLAALAAAIAWLRSNKLTKGITAGVPDDSNVQELFSATNNSYNGSAIRINSGAATASNPTIKAYVDAQVGSIETALQGV